ncbi:MAG: hypothetical protein A3I01_09030 [Betaproteobacteria bacterium RIFCSPLOWO2_02_FULL_65_24]|nr:MAG: hypothetical protein A3I01_09030 [Betaproteobacteria bacterium RIFCSPLOWO2_02_FULL_65_24]
MNLPYIMLKTGFTAFAGSLPRTTVSFACTAPAVRVTNVRPVYIVAGSAPAFSSYMTSVVTGVILTFWLFATAMSIAGNTEYRLDPETGMATSMNGGVMPVTAMLNVPSAAVVPLVVLPALS